MSKVITSTEAEIKLMNLDNRLETGQISLPDFLKALHTLIADVLDTRDEEVITTLATHLRPTQP